MAEVQFNSPDRELYFVRYGPNESQEEGLRQTSRKRVAVAIVGGERCGRAVLQDWQLLLLLYLLLPFLLAATTILLDCDSVSGGV